MRRLSKRINKAVSSTKKFLEINDASVFHYQNRDPLIHGSESWGKDPTGNYVSFINDPEEEQFEGYSIAGVGLDDLYLNAWLKYNQKGTIKSYSLVFNEVFTDPLLGPIYFEATIETKLKGKNGYKKYLKALSGGFSEYVIGSIDEFSDLDVFAQYTANLIDLLPGVLPKSANSTCVSVVELEPINFRQSFCA